jgi:hypothetical protein
MLGCFVQEHLLSSLDLSADTSSEDTQQEERVPPSHDRACTRGDSTMAGGYEQARRDVRKIDRRVLKQVNNLTNAKTEWRGRVRTKNFQSHGGSRDWINSTLLSNL